VRLATEVINNNPNLLILDTINDSNGAHWRNSLEALIRRTWAANPNTRIILMRFATFTDRTTNSTVNSPVNSAALVEFDAIAAAYGLTVVDWVGALQTLVNGGANLSDYINVDNVHPSTTGYALAASLLQSYLPSGGTSKPGTLPSRVYDNGDYENTPVKMLGTAYTSRTGSWTDVGSSAQSSSAGAIINFNNITCQSIGCYRSDGGTNDVQLSIDGGAYADFVFYQNGTQVNGGVRGTHDFAIKVKSGTVKIDEFWAV
jgi:hypothetical protein